MLESSVAAPTQASQSLLKMCSHDMAAILSSCPMQQLQNSEACTRSSDNPIPSGTTEGAQGPLSTCTSGQNLVPPWLPPLGKTTEPPSVGLIRFTLHPNQAHLAAPAQVYLLTESTRVNLIGCSPRLRVSLAAEEIHEGRSEGRSEGQS